MTAAPPTLSPADRAVVEAALDDLRRIFGRRLQAMAVYGVSRREDGEPLRTIVLVDRLSFDDLAVCAPLVRTWRTWRLDAPLLLERDEFDRTLDVFPLEYGRILADHVPVAGADVFAGARVEDADIRRAVELQAKSLLIHLREGFLETAGEAAAIGELIGASAPALEAVLGGIAGLCDEPAGDLPAMAERRMGVPADVIRDVLAAGRRPPSAAEDLTPLASRYLDALRGIWRVLDTWQTRP